MNHSKNFESLCFTMHGSVFLMAYFGSTAMNGLNPGVMSIDISKVNNRE